MLDDKVGKAMCHKLVNNTNVDELEESLGMLAKSVVSGVATAIKKGIDKSFDSGAFCERNRIAIELLKEGSLSYKVISEITCIPEKDLRSINLDKLNNV